MNRHVALGLKLFVAGALVTWLVHSGTLDFGALRAFVDRPALLAADLGVLAFAIVLGALRWRLLLSLADVRLTLRRAVQLHLAGLFFNVVIPGNIGGDVVKAVYVARELPAEKRPAVYLVGFIDRLMGVLSLVALALCVTLARGSAMWTTPGLRDLALGVSILSGVSLGVPLIVLIVLRHTANRREAAPTTTLRRLVAAARITSTRIPTLASALLLAIGLHLSGMALFIVLTGQIASGNPALGGIAVIYPLGMLTTVIPVSYAGIGVGHVAFERLFALVGMGGGATVFNVFLIGQTVPCLFGVFPYLALRRSAPPPTEAEARSQQVVGYDASA